MELRSVGPDSQWLEGRRPFVRLLADATAELGGRLFLESRYGHVGRVERSGARDRPIFGNALGLNPDAATMLSADKDYTARLLAAEGIATPAGVVLFSAAYQSRMKLKNASVANTLRGLEAAEAFAAEWGYPVTVKPNLGSEGRGVRFPRDAEELRADLDTLFQTDDRVRLEAFADGFDTRVTVFDGTVRLAYRRLPPTVECDGVTELGGLIDAFLVGVAARHRGSKLARDDVRIARALDLQGWHLSSLPPAGTRVRLLTSANLSTGGQMEDLTGKLPPDAERLAIRVAAHLGLRLAGVDILSPDLTQGVEGAVVLEVNAAPGLDYYASAGHTQWQRALALVRDALQG